MATDATIAEIEKKIDKWAEQRRRCLRYAAVHKIMALLSFSIALGNLAAGQMGFWFWAFLASCMAAILIGMSYEFTARELEGKINGNN